MSAFVEVSGITKCFRGSPFSHSRSTVRALDGVSFGIEKNSILGLVGESGCGKTTLARALLWLSPPDKGQIRFDGVTLGEANRATIRDIRRRMQIIVQDPNSALNPRITVGRSLEEGMANLGLRRLQRTERVAELLELVGIKPDRAKEYPYQFSGGQRQRIVIARSISTNPDFLVLDEPVSSLDVSIQAQIINLLLELRTRLSLTYLFITHDLGLVSYLSDSIVVMKAGKVVEMGQTHDILTKPSNPYTERLVASALDQVPASWRRAWSKGIA